MPLYIEQSGHRDDICHSRQCKKFASCVNFFRKNIFSRESRTQISGSLIDLCFFLLKNCKIKFNSNKNAKITDMKHNYALISCVNNFANYAHLRCQIFSLKSGSVIFFWQISYLCLQLEPLDKFKGFIVIEPFCIDQTLSIGLVNLLVLVC